MQAQLLKPIWSQKWEHLNQPSYGKVIKDNQKVHLSQVFFAIKLNANLTIGNWMSFFFIFWLEK